MKTISPSPIAGFRYKTEKQEERNSSPYFEERKSTVRISADKVPAGYTAYPNLPITSNAETLAEYLDILKACGIVPEIDSNHEFALLPAEELGFSLTIGREDKTSFLYKIAARKNQIPMILILRPITK